MLAAHRPQGRSNWTGMVQTLWTVGTVLCKPGGQNFVQSAINYAHEMALANAVITLKLRDEMMPDCAAGRSQIPTSLLWPVAC